MLRQCASRLLSREVLLRSSSSLQLPLLETTQLVKSSPACFKHIPGQNVMVINQRRYCSSAATTPAKETEETEETESMVDKGMSYWLFTVAGMVFAIVIVGGVTRLTESGLSISYWKPVTGMIPPLTDEQWEKEFEIYKATPEYAQNPTMDLAHFKSIFFWEWFHRALGRTVGMVYFFPLCYFLAKKRPQRLGINKRLAFFGSLGALQGAIGWLMVKSGLQHKNFEDGSKATVSPYRLALHLGTAFILFLGLTSTAVHLHRGTIRKKVSPALKPLRPYVHGALGWVFATAMTGAAVAGLDAGWIYCEFPKMGNGYVPPAQELFLEKCGFWPRNLYENPVFAQFAHRCMAMGSIVAVGALTAKAAYTPAIHAALVHSPAGKAIVVAQVLILCQVTLGIYTLINETPINLAVLHQGGSLAVLTSLIGVQVLLL